MYGAQSEYRPLRKVIMHRPSDEVTLVTESNKREFLYRAPVSKEKIQKEHDSYTEFLKDQHVEVILTSDTLCPNLLFTRDVASVTQKGALLMRPKFAPRFFEPYYLEKIFESEHIPTTKITRGCCEGGDLVYFNKDILMVGIGPRTDLEGLFQLKDQLLGTTVKEIIAVPLPSTRVHLDGTLMMIDKDVAVLHPGSLQFPAKCLKEDYVVNIFQFLKDEGCDIIRVPDKEIDTFGPNVVVVKPGLVVSYAWNTHTISELKERGCEVFPLEGYELVKAGGGPHCMICPVVRE